MSFQIQPDFIQTRRNEEEKTKNKKLKTKKYNIFTANVLFHDG